MSLRHNITERPLSSASYALPNTVKDQKILELLEKQSYEHLKDQVKWILQSQGHKKYTKGLALEHGLSTLALF